VTFQSAATASQGATALSGDQLFNPDAADSRSLMP